MKEQSSVTKKSSWGRSAASSRILLGYTYNWVKSVLREKVFGKLKIILSLDFPRVAPISTSYTSTESVEVEESNAGSFVENVSPTLHTAAKRFSLMTGKSRVTRIPVAQAPEQARPTSRGRSVRTKGGKRSSATSVDEGKNNYNMLLFYLCSA